MNPIIPLGILAGGVGIYAYSKKKTPADHLEAKAQEKAVAKVTESKWNTPMSVSDVQGMLNLLGAQPQLATDGIAGPKTTAAIKSFQAKAGISVDGIVGPQTETAMHNALGGDQARGWFLEAQDEEEQWEEEQWEREEQPLVVGPGAGRQHRIRDREEWATGARGHRLLPSEVVSHHGQEWAAGAGWGGSSASWGAPSVCDITNDPQQRMQIGLLEMRRAQAQAAFPGAKAAGYDYSFLPDQGASELQEAEAAYYGLENERQANLNAVSGAYDEEEEFATGGNDWSAPDVCEIYRDPVQMAQVWGHMMQPPVPYEYGYTNPNPGYYPGTQGSFGYLPFPPSTQGYYTQPGQVAAVPGLGMLPGVSNVTSQGYEIAPGQAGRRY